MIESAVCQNTYVNSPIHMWGQKDQYFQKTNRSNSLKEMGLFLSSKLYWKNPRLKSKKELKNEKGNLKGYVDFAAVCIKL